MDRDILLALRLKCDESSSTISAIRGKDGQVLTDMKAFYSVILTLTSQLSSTSLIKVSVDAFHYEYSLYTIHK